MNASNEGKRVYINYLKRERESEREREREREFVCGYLVGKQAEVCMAGLESESSPEGHRSQCTEETRALTS